MGVLDRAAEQSNEREILEDRIRNRVTEVVRAYRHSWDVFSELIQNSVDSINRRYRVHNDPDFYLYEEARDNYEDIESNPSYTGRIKIEFDNECNKVTIKDNGTGIKRENIESFLLPESTDKVEGTEYGFKGYGLTFAAFISNSFEIKSKHFVEDNTHKLALSSLLNWLTDSEGNTEFPDEPQPNVTESDEQLEEWNTIITLSISDNYSELLPAISAADQAFDLIEHTKREENRPEGFEYILRSRTAIGNTKHLFNSAPDVQIDVSINIDYEDGSTIREYEVPYTYYHPKEHDELGVDSYNFAEYIDKYTRTTFEPSFRSLYYAPEDKESVGTRKTIDCKYALCTVAQNRLSNIEDDLGLSQIETGDTDITYGVHLSIDGMPTGLRIDNWDTKGVYLKRYFVIIDAELNLSDQLDPGRKGISNYFSNLISDRALNLINEETVGGSDPFSRYASRHLNHGRGGGGGGLPPQELQRMVEQVRNNGEEQPDELKELVRECSSLQYCPTDEQEVIALFYQTLKGEIIKGYETVYQASTSAVYDAAFDYKIDCSDQSNLYPDDPVGVGQVLVEDLRNRGESEYAHANHYSGQTALPELCVEFKQTVGGFLDEIHNRSGKTSKASNDIDILAVWDTTISVDVPQDIFTIDPISDNKRIFHGVTHRLGVIGQDFSDIRIISLKHVIEESVST